MNSNTEIHESLIDAIYNHNLELTKSLVENGADIHFDNDSALTTAIRKGVGKIIEYLLEKGADIHNVPNTAINEGLITAIEEYDYDLILYFLENGADIHAYNELSLSSAIKGGDMQLIRYLLQHGANIHNIPTTEMHECLTISIYVSNFEIVRYLILNDADIHSNNDSALTTAIKSGNMQIVKYLIKHGANISVGLKFFENNNNTYKYKKIYKYFKSLMNPKPKPTFKEFANKIINKNLNKNKFYKWQTLCSILDNKNFIELQNLATLQDIDIKDKSKRQLCKMLSQQYTVDISKPLKCNNETTLLGDDVTLIPKPLLFTVIEGDFEYCFNIIELLELINTGAKRNPYTRVFLPIDLIKNKMLKLRSILLSDSLSLVNILDEIRNNDIMDKKSILKLKIVNLVALLKYTPNINEIINMSTIKVKSMFNLLNQNPLMKVFGKKTIGNLINESIRLLQIQDVNNETRKAAYEIYLNNVIRSENDENDENEERDEHGPRRSFRDQDEEESAEDEEESAEDEEEN